MSDEQQAPQFPFPIPPHGMRIEIGGPGSKDDDPDELYERHVVFELDAYRFLALAAIDAFDGVEPVESARFRWDAIRATLDNDMPRLLEAIREWMTLGTMRHGAPNNAAASLGNWMTVVGEAVSMIRATREIRIREAQEKEEVME